VLSIEVAATGLTLVQASIVVFAELKWTPADHQQAEDRVHRIGQARDVEIFYLHAQGSIDDRIWEILEKKLVMISNVIATKTVTFETDTNAQ
jgi:SWI/SNF-related matrix-associated actin-dependent regulator 1 of chromatin subfamily A